MKHTKQILCLLLALVMVFGLGITAFAAGDADPLAETPTSTLPPDKDGISTELVVNETTHDYRAYQIFTGTQADNKTALGDVQWGSGVDGAALLAALKTDTRLIINGKNIFAESNSAADVAAILAADRSGMNKDLLARYFANVADNHRKPDNATPKPYVDIPATKDGKPLTQIELPVGYWLIVDITPVSDQNPDNKDKTDLSANHALLQLTNGNGITIKDKTSVPTVDKSVLGSDDTTVSNVADYSIGDLITFTLTGKLPTNYLAYETYYYQFTDTLSPGLDYVNAASGANKLQVMLHTPLGDGVTSTQDGTETDWDVTEYFTVKPSAYSEKDGTTLTITCSDLHTITTLKAGSRITPSSTITVTYKAKLNANAVTGNPGNPNKVFLTFSNNPNVGGESSTGHTPEETVWVFTYAMDNVKMDQDRNPLSGAEFILLNAETITTGTMIARFDANHKLVSWDPVDSAYVKDEQGNNTEAYREEYIMRSGEDGKFKAIGVDEGIYYLLETKAPLGYNLPTAPFKVTITREFKEKKEGEARTLTKLQIQVDQRAAESGNIKDGTVSAQIENGQGNTLPETGGIGTTIFYVVGSILLIGAAVLLITKKRMSTSK